MRITDQMTKNNVNYYLQKNLTRLDKTNAQLSTGKRFVLPEDDPINAVINMKYRAKITENEQYQRNIDDAITWLNTADRSLEHGLSLLQRVRDLCVYGANDTLAADDRKALALEVNQLLNGLVDVANTELKGDYIFAGHNTQEPPFAVKKGNDSGQTPHVLSHDWEGGLMEDALNVNNENITEIIYEGDNGDLLRQIQHSKSTEINDSGSFVFQSGKHTIKGGNFLSDAYSIINSPLNFNQDINKLDGEGVFSIGVKGSKLTPITYDADRDSLTDLIRKINNAEAGVTASYVKELDTDKNVIYRLVLTADEAGKEIQIQDAGREKFTRSEGAISGINTLDNWYGLYAPASAPAAGESVVINGEQFVLNDYATVQDFMSAVEQNLETGIEDFSFNTATNTFSITASAGNVISLHQENYSPGAGFFERARINDSGNLMERMGMVNKIVGTQAMLNGDPKDDTSRILLKNIPGNTIKSGTITVNGFPIEIDTDIDNLESIANKINQADIGVTAQVEAVVDPATGVFDPNPANRLYRMVLISDKPKEIVLTDRNTDFLRQMGLQEPCYSEKPDTSGLPNANLHPRYGSVTNPNEHNVFQAIMNIRDDLFADDDNRLSNEDLAAIDDAIESILQTRSRIGARVNTFETSQQKLEDVNINTQELLSKIEDVDLAETIMELKMQESIYRASLSAGARLMQPTLLDFIR